LAAWGSPTSFGHGVTGLQRPVFWGIYIGGFLFWIGISHAGTLISAILRLTGAAWRKPVTRAAEAITVFALMIGGMFPIIHLGRPGVFYWLLPYPTRGCCGPNSVPRCSGISPAIVTYVTGSVIYRTCVDPRPGALGEHNTPWRQKLYPPALARLDRLAIASAPR